MRLTKIKYDMTLMKYMSFFESLTRSKLKDCFEISGVLVFVVYENEIGKAVGLKGANIKRIEKSLNRKIKILEFNSNMPRFVENVIYPLKAKDIRQEEDVVTVVADNKIRGLLIGRNAQNLRNYETIVKRYFPLKELKVEHDK